MRGIQNNFNQLQINQMAMEQAAIQAAKKNQPDRMRSEMAEEILKQQDPSRKSEKKDSKTSPIHRDGKNKSNQPSFKNQLYSKEGTLKTETDESSPEIINPASANHRIDFKV